VSTYALAYDKRHLHLHVYAGAEGDFTLIEDDGVSERYRTDDAVVETRFRLTQQDDRRRFHVGGGTGHYEGTPEERTYTIHVHGLADKKDVDERDFIERTSWERRDEGTLMLTIETKPLDYKKALQVAWHE